MKISTLFKKSDDVVREIHASFDSAQDELLEQAKQIIASTEKDPMEKAKTLESLGFTNSEPVVKMRQKTDALLKSKEDAELVNYYKVNYPFLKFLKESQLDEICNKYGLIYAPVSRYKKDVPEKNVEEIASAQRLKGEDEATSQAIYEFYPYCYINNKDFNKAVRVIGGKTRFTDDELLNIIDKESHNLLYPNIVRRNLDDFIWEFTHQHKSLASTLSTVEKATVDKKGLFIAAPKSHFDTKGLKKKGFGFMNISIVEVKDPIVFRYCRGGIQVLSKWGIEAEDKMLVNETLN